MYGDQSSTYSLTIFTNIVVPQERHPGGKFLGPKLDPLENLQRRLDVVTGSRCNAQVKLGDTVSASGAFSKAARIIQDLAATLGDDELRQAYLSHPDRVAALQAAKASGRPPRDDGTIRIES